MPDAVITRRRNTLLFASGYEGFNVRHNYGLAENGDQVLEFSGLPVFRSGDFADSMGMRQLWEDLHMTQMQANYTHLQQSQIFGKVPIRKGHGGFLDDSMKTLVGWHTNLTTAKHTNPVDGVEYTYVLVDGYLFDEEAIRNFSGGHWPNRSSEIGTYISNSEAEYWPTYMGFAFVDLPAVEGLNFRKFEQDGAGRFSVLVQNPKEFGVPDAPSTSGQPADSSGSPSTGTGQPAAPPAAPTPPAAPPAAAATPPAAPPAVTPPAAGGATNQAFTINGQQITDYAAVQAHIAVLEGFQTETVTAGRTAYVAGLASAQPPKIGANQIDALTKLAVGMTAAQFEQFKASYDAVPGVPGLANHGTDASGSTDNGAAPSTPTELDTAREIVHRHRISGMSDEQLQKLPSYKLVAAAEANGQSTK